MIPEPRFAPLIPQAMTPEQRRVADAIASGPRGGLRGPFNALLRSPELADRAQKLGEYLRFGTCLPAPLKELAILLTARHWRAQYEWYAHSSLARKAGLEDAIIAAIAEGRPPASLSPAQAAVHGFCTEILETKEVSDAAFDAARRAFGEQGAIELVGLVGYYSLVAMVLNVDRYPLPEGVAPPLTARK